MHVLTKWLLLCLYAASCVGIEPKTHTYSVSIQLADGNKRTEQVSFDAGVPHVSGTLEHVYVSDNAKYVIKYEAGSNGYTASYHYVPYKVVTESVQLSAAALKVLAG